MARTFARIQPDTLRERLASGIIRFQFEKTDGSLREAVGTTNDQYIDPAVRNRTPKQIQKRDPRIIRYYDIDKKYWRSLKESTSIFEVE